MHDSERKRQAARNALYYMISVPRDAGDCVGTSRAQAQEKRPQVKTIDGREMIPKAECKDRHVYRIHSRNLLLGVYRAETGGFLGLRRKWSDVYVFEEYHWENGEPHGTVAPQEELPESLPADIPNTDDLGSECFFCHVRTEYVLYPDGPRTVTDSGGSYQVKGAWTHMEPTDCVKVDSRRKGNLPLNKFIRAMTEKYAPEFFRGEKP